MRYLFLILIILVVGCVQGQGSGQVIKASVGNAELYLEVAASPGDRAKGLMYRGSLGEKEGMLFVFEDKGYHAIWMKNVRFPIDILWLDDDMRVVYIFREAPPCRADPCPVYMPSSEARYVLELPANFTLKHGIGIGDKLDLETAYRAP